MTPMMEKILLDAQNEIYQWKLRAYAAEAKLAEIQEKDSNGDN